MKPQVLKGHLDLLLLTALESGPAHGYAVVKEVGRRSGGALELAEGTAYPALHRLEREGLIESEWSEASGRRRRVYRLTRRGRAALSGEREEWRRFARGMRAVLGETG